MERTFPRAIDALAEIVQFVEEYAGGRVPRGQLPVIHLVIEEIFTNMVRHNADGEDQIALALDRNEHDFTITMTDRDSERFDIREQEDVDVSAPLEDRKPGGLGIHLVKHLVDEIHYRYRDGVSVITLIKKLEPLHA